MAFLKKANGVVVHRDFSPENWGNFIGHNRHKLANGPYRTASTSPNILAQASEILQDEFSPDKYLLTHSTIVASVDTEEVSNVKLGALIENGRTINRKWSNYRVTPATEGWINNNNDSWDRPVLLKSYRTFIGAFNFLEHVQIEEQAKGRIIDAVARDIGPSVYVDILTATDRRHASLVRDIESGKMSTLSMGCSVTHTACTKCGNVAADETEMCPCIKYEKGNMFFDEQGTRRRVAELCGHDSIDPTGGVNFIEASWVAVPAFQGAVLRNLLQPETVSPQVHDQMRSVLASPPPEWSSHEGQTKAARLSTPRVQRFVVTAGEDEPMEDPMAPPPGDDAGGAPPPADDPGGMPDPMAPGGAPGEEQKDPFEELEGDVEKYVLDKIRKKIKEKMQEEVSEDAASEPGLATSTNENINRQASERMASGLDALIRIARSDIELIDGLARLQQSYNIKFSREIYRTACRVGSTDKYHSLEKYLQRCAGVLNRKPTVGEAKTLVRLGRILSLRKKTRF